MKIIRASISKHTFLGVKPSGSTTSTCCVEEVFCAYMRKRIPREYGNGYNIDNTSVIILSNLYVLFFTCRYLTQLLFIYQFTFFYKIIFIVFAAAFQMASHTYRRTRVFSEIHMRRNPFTYTKFVKKDAKNSRTKSIQHNCAT